MNTEFSRPKLPLFPLPLVLFPYAHLPLTIFEDRYKLMFERLLTGDRRFGVVLSEDNKFAKVGCIATVDQFVKYANGSFEVSTIGSSRFVIKEIASKDPYMTAQVELLQDEQQFAVEAYKHAAEVRRMLDDIIGLSAKMVDSHIKVNEIWPSDPVSLSFMVPDVFFGSNGHKQKLLEMTSVSERLRNEMALLKEARNFLAAQTALKDAVG